METLEQTLSHVDSLWRDLNAEIVLQEGDGHLVEYEGYGKGGYYGQDEPSSQTRWVETISRITKPDEEKRENARQQLQQVYDSSQWYRARYDAGNILGISSESQLNLWTCELEKELDSTKKENRLVEYQVEELEISKGYSGVQVSTRIEMREIDVPDEQRRLKAVKDLSRLFEASKSLVIKDILTRAYEENECKKVKKKAGDALDYPSIKIWYHNNEENIGATGCLITGLAITSGIGYLIYLYLNR